MENKNDIVDGDADVLLPPTPTPPVIIVRRSLIGDAHDIRLKLVIQDNLILSKRYGAYFNIAYLIETSFLCITGFNDDGDAVAFAAFSDTPSNSGHMNMQTMGWEVVVDDAISSNVAAKGCILPCNTLFLTFFATKFGNGVYSESKNTTFDGYCLNNISITGRDAEHTIMNQILSTVFATCPRITRIAFINDLDTPPFLPVTDVMYAVPLVKTDDKDGQKTLHGFLYTSQREDINIPLVLRRAILEDYDDFVPLLLKGVGLVTPLPQTMYLDEILQDDNEYKAVIVSEDPETHRSVGIMCIDATFERQQECIKHYRLEAYHKLKPMMQPQSEQFQLTPIESEKNVVSDTDPIDPQLGTPCALRHASMKTSFVVKKAGNQNIATKGQHHSHNSFQITFFYLNPEYDDRCVQFLPYAFSIFPFAEYCFIYLPHSQPEHPLLYHFNYCRLHRFVPTNAAGNRLPFPDGMWVCCRYLFEETKVMTYSSTKHEEAIDAMMQNQQELKEENVHSLMEELSVASDTSSDSISQNVSPKPSGAAFTADTNGRGGREEVKRMISLVLQWRGHPVGVIVCRRLKISDTFALRRNFDIEEITNFRPKANITFTATDLHQNRDVAKTRYYRDDMPCALIQFVYIRAIFRHHLRFLMRETLRLLGVQVLLYAISPLQDFFSPLVEELIYVKPRQVSAKWDCALDGPENELPKKNFQNIIFAPQDVLSGTRESHNQEIDSTFCVFQTTRKNLSDAKTNINSRIVVVGASTTGLSFIHTLITAPGLRFTEVLLVSTDGLPVPYSLDPDELPWYSSSLDLSTREHALLALKHQIRVIEDSMVDFDRNSKFIVTSNGMCEPYDKLIFTSGRQYAIPKEMMVQFGMSTGTAENNNKYGVVTVKSVADLVMIVKHVSQTAFDGESKPALMEKSEQEGPAVDKKSHNYSYNEEQEEAIDGYTREYEEEDLPDKKGMGNYENVDEEVMQNNFSESPEEKFLEMYPKSYCIIYGNGLDAFGIAACVLKLGWPPEKLMIVAPDFEINMGTENINDKGPFMSAHIVKKVAELMENVQCIWLRGYSLHKLNFDEGSNKLISVSLISSSLSFRSESTSNGSLQQQRQKQSMGNDESVEGLMEFPTSLFVYAQDKDIDKSILSALNKRSIVFDGRVIVENNYRTTDRDIFAAGPVAMFSLRFGTSRDFEEFSCREVGAHVAQVVMGFLGVDEYYDPILMGGSAEQGGEEDATEEKKGNTSGSIGSTSNGDHADSSSVLHSTVQKPNPVPKYIKALSRYVELPGGYIYFSCQSANFSQAYVGLKCEHLTYSECDSFIRISVGETRYIECILYCGPPGKIDVLPLRQLVGLPESLLNLCYNYYEYALCNKIEDSRGQKDIGKSKELNLIHFLQSPWAYLLFYDKFPQMFEKTKMKLKTMSVPEVESVYADGLAVLQVEGNAEMPKRIREKLVKTLTEPETAARRIVELELVDFMHRQKVFLPQLYYLPNIESHIRQEH